MRMRNHLTIVFLTLAMLAFAGRANGQAGGGTVTSEPAGGAMIFRKPDNPPVHSGSGGSGAASGGTISRGRRKPARPPVNVKEQALAKANAARSAATPRYSEAETQYKVAAREDPRDERAYAGLGNVYLDQGRFQEAVAAYQEALKLKKDYAVVYQPLSYSLAQLNRFPEAIDTLERALEYEENNPEIHNNLAFAYMHAERYHDAVSESQRAIALLGQTGDAYKQGLQNRNEVLSHAYKNLGNAYNGLNRYSEAADALKKAVEIEPSNAAAQFNLGLTLYNGKRYSEAIEAYKAVIKLKPQLAAAHYNLGLTFVAISDKVGARAQYETLKSLNPEMASELQRLIRP